jgi:hypothetical protein
MFHLFGCLDHLPCRLKNRIVAEILPEFEIKVPAGELAFNQASLPNRLGWAPTQTDICGIAAHVNRV